LVTNVGLVDVGALGESNLEHGDGSAELEVIQSFHKWLVLVNNGDVADLVDLMKTLNSMLDELSEVHCRLDSIGHTLDDNGVVCAFIA